MVPISQVTSKANQNRKYQRYHVAFCNINKQLQIFEN